MTYPRLERCFLESTVKDVNGYSYFQFKEFLQFGFSYKW